MGNQINQVALAGVAVHQSAMATIADNVSSADAVGAERQIVTITSGGPGGPKAHVAQRVTDPQTTRRLWEATSALSYTTSKASQLASLTERFGRPGAEDTTLHGRMGALSNALEALSLRPNDAKNLAHVAADAHQLAENMNMISDSIQEIRQAADAEIANLVQQYAEKIDSVSTVTRHIGTAKVLGQSTASLESHRDQLLKEISELIGITVEEKGNYGEFLVSTAFGKPLLRPGCPPEVLSFQSVGVVTAETSYGTGLNGLRLWDKDITQQVTDSRQGRLSALLEIRDVEMIKCQAHLDQLTEKLRDHVNAAHNEGTAYTPPASLRGSKTFAGTPAQISFSNGTGAVNVVIMSDRVGQSNTGDATISKYRVDSFNGMDFLTIDCAQLRNGGTFLGTTFAADPTLQELVTLLNGANGFNANVCNIDPSDNHLTFDASVLGANKRIGIVPDKTAPGTVQVTSTATGTITPALGFSHTFGLNNFYETDNAHPGDEITGIAAKLALRRDISGIDNRGMARGHLIQEPTGPAFVANKAAINDATGDVARKMSQAMRDETIAFPAVSGFSSATAESVLSYARSFFEAVSRNTDTARTSSDEASIIYNATEDLHQKKAAIDLMQELTNLGMTQTALAACLRLLDVCQDVTDKIINIAAR